MYKDLLRYNFDPHNFPHMAFRLDHPKRENAQIKLEIYISGETSRFKYNTGQNINRKNWDKKKCFSVVS